MVPSIITRSAFMRFSSWSAARWPEAVSSDFLDQHVVHQPGALVAPGLADLHDPLLALGVDREQAMRIAELDRLDHAGELEVLVVGPAPAMMGEGGAGERAAEQDGTDADQKRSPGEHGLSLRCAPRQSI